MNDQSVPLRPSETAPEAPSQAPLISPDQPHLEGMEFATEVKEVVGEQPNETSPQPSGKKSSSQKDDTQTHAGLPLAERIALLSKEAPPVQIMKKLVERAIERQIEELRKDMRHALKEKGGPNYYTLQNIYLKICSLKEILASLAHAAAEYIRKLWFQFVHGITV